MVVVLLAPIGSARADPGDSKTFEYVRNGVASKAMAQSLKCAKRKCSEQEYAEFLKFCVQAGVPCGPKTQPQGLGGRFPTSHPSIRKPTHRKVRAPDAHVPAPEAASDPSTDEG